MSSLYTEKAYAKINLTLEIIGRRTDGYHELVSLVAFARDAFDFVTIKPAPNFSYHVTGAYSHNIGGPNIVVRTVEKAAEKLEAIQPGTIELIKNLPVAAGLGGGSADAAAVLRALGQLNNISDIEAAFGSICTEIGADVPVCLLSGTANGALMWGIGEHVWRAPAAHGHLFPSGVSAVLANPGVPVPTGDVFRALKASPLDAVPTAPALPGTFKTFNDLLQFLRNSRNDLEKPALSITPAIQDVLFALKTLPHCELARMSGSGATCFGLFQNFAQAQAAKAQLAQAQPQWWIEATRL